MPKASGKTPKKGKRKLQICTILGSDQTHKCSETLLYPPHSISVYLFLSPLSLLISNSNLNELYCESNLITLCMSVWCITACNVYTFLMLFMFCSAMLWHHKNYCHANKVLLNLNLILFTSNPSLSLLLSNTGAPQSTACLLLTSMFTDLIVQTGHVAAWNSAHGWCNNSLSIGFLCMLQANFTGRRELPIR